MKTLGKLKKDFGVGPMGVPCACYCGCKTREQASQDSGYDSNVNVGTM